MNEASTEQLLEALQSLNTTRAMERQARAEAEHLLNALNALANADSEAEIFSAIIRALKAAIPFERAAIFLWDSEQGHLSRSAGADLGAETIHNTGSFAKALAGRAIILMNTAKCQEWCALNASPAGTVQSAILAPVGSQNRKGLIICIHPDKSQFNKQHLSMLKKFSPLVTQALHRVQLKEMEKQLSHLNRSIALKSQFMAILSHELRTPINGVIGVSQLLSETPLNTEQQAWIGMIQSSGTNLLNFVNEILEFSKIEAGKIELERTTFSPDTLFEDLLSLFAFQQRETGVPLYTIIDPNIANGLTGDTGRIKQILVNYLSNAFKYTEKGSIRLTLELKGHHTPPDEASLTESPPIQTVRFTVIDTGIGLTEEEQENVFNAFYQTEYARKKQIKGTGLGLNICQRIASMLGGTVGVESHAGQGSAFWLELSLPVTPFECYEPMPDFTVGILAEGYAALHLKSLVKRLRLTPIVIGPDIAEITNVNVDCYVLHHSALTDQINKDSTDFEPASRRPCLALMPYTGTRAQGSDIENTMRDKKHGCKIINAQTFSRDCLRQYLTNGFQLPNNETRLLDKPKQKSRSLHNCQILVAEDNEVNQIVITGLIKNFGATVTVAKNGLEAVELYKMKSNFFSLIIMDCQMPVCDGYEATKQIRLIQREPSVRRCPIIGLSAHVLPVHYTQAMNAGMDDYLTKPITKNALQHIFDTYLDVGFDQ